MSSIILWLVYRTNIKGDRIRGILVEALKSVVDRGTIVFHRLFDSRSQSQNLLDGNSELLTNFIRSSSAN